ncbi:PTS lactose transporter subunit IIB [Corynebacterium poyangense]|uniref:PTS lactose transporter subunit IIB n=1 Tax=Corynebacterium poyangense TaxID=2684405 RepID=A0A7H0SPB8_9CORY|nr:PTS sugar transporter subunit IIB [Corynebacterium poyangense]MBZ8177969.1 PTS lactose transporter subunit IIB [Corynebacterium poyangense]QNQ90393.1 PTS lactose transporter subunit IIB [Corynebacterium poyangense]
MKFMAMCSSGLGSSFMVELNIKNALQELGVNDAEVTHSDLGGASPNDADVFVIGRDLADATDHFPNRVILDSIIDKAELKKKLAAVCQEKGLL